MRLSLLCLLVEIVQAQSTEVYDLPTFAFTLSVDKSEDELVEFQDSLIGVLDLHLTDFFQAKIDTPSFRNTKVVDIAISSAFLWNEQKSGEPKTSDSTMVVNKYDVRSNFASQLEVEYESQSGEDSRLTQSIIDLMLIEAFKGDNYWALVHRFLSDNVLDDITGIKVMVFSEGYVEYNGQDPSYFNVYDSQSGWTLPMILGVVFAGVFCTVLCLMWAYLCCCVRGGSRFRLKRLFRKRSTEKAESVTDDMYSTDSLSPEDDDDQLWLDDWAASITSIKLRELVKYRKSRRSHSVRHPGHHHSSCLNAIEEGDDENSTVASVEEYVNRQRVRNAGAQTSMEVGPVENHSYDPETTTLHSNHSPFEYSLSQPQLDSINELC